jgi:hypothetical protein
VGASLSRLLFRSGAVREAQQRFEQAAGLADDARARSDLLADAASTARCRVRGEDAHQLDELAVEAARAIAGDEGQEVLARRLETLAETVNRFAGMFAAPPPGDSVAAALDELAALPPVDEDPVRTSAALDARTAADVESGLLAEADETARTRLAGLPATTYEPALALELKDALHMSTLLACGTGDLRMALESGDRHRDLPFLREQRDLALEPGLLPAALAGRWSDLLESAEVFSSDWEASGRPSAHARAIGPYAVAVVHGMLGRERDRRRWLRTVAALRNRPVAEAGRGSGYASSLDALLLLHLDRPEQALRTLAAPDDAVHWYRRLMRWWRAALVAEATVLAGAPDARESCRRAREACQTSPVLSLVVRRAEILGSGEADALVPLAEEFAEAGAPYQHARTLHLAGGRFEKSAHEAFARLHASVGSDS